MSMQTTSDNAEGEPMLDVNVTPLIDVMLVLRLSAPALSLSVRKQTPFA